MFTFLFPVALSFFLLFPVFRCRPGWGSSCFGSVKPPEPKPIFCRLFKKQSGETPMHFFMRQKVELSKEMLNSGERNSDIASVTGFADEFHFSRSFKKITGISPRQYRNK